MDDDVGNNGCYVVRSVCHAWLIVCLTTLATIATVSLVTGFLGGDVAVSVRSLYVSPALFRYPSHRQQHQSPSLPMRFDDRGVNYYRRQADGRLAIGNREVEDRLVSLLRQHHTSGSQPPSGREIEDVVDDLNDVFSTRMQKNDIPLQGDDDDASELDDASVNDGVTWLSNVLAKWLQLESDRRLKHVVDDLAAVVEGKVTGRRRRGPPVPINIHEQENEYV
jgi:hypothetical protein